MILKCHVFILFKDLSGVIIIYSVLKIKYKLGFKMAVWPMLTLPLQADLEKTEEAAAAAGQGETEASAQ